MHGNRVQLNCSVMPYSTSSTLIVNCWLCECLPCCMRCLCLLGWVSLGGIDARVFWGALCALAELSALSKGNLSPSDFGVLKENSCCCRHAVQQHTWKICFKFVPLLMSKVKWRQTAESQHKFNLWDLLNSLVIVHIFLAANKSTKAESSNETLLFLFVIKLTAVQNQVETHKGATLFHRKCFFIATNMTWHDKHLTTPQWQMRCNHLLKIIVNKCSFSVWVTGAIQLFPSVLRDDSELCLK